MAASRIASGHIRRRSRGSCRCMPNVAKSSPQQAPMAAANRTINTGPWILPAMIWLQSAASRIPNMVNDQSAKPMQNAFVESLAGFPLQFLEPVMLRACLARAPSLVALGPAHPFAQGLRCAANLARNRPDRRPLGVVSPLVLESHPYRPFPDLRGSISLSYS